MSTHRFKPGDVILILPKFAHLYPSDSGTVIRVDADPFRPIFNEYTIEFADGSTENLFEFQILESGPGFQTLIAPVEFDSQRQSPVSETRGARSDRQIILRTADFDIDMAIHVNKNRASIIGQVLERNTAHLLKRTEIRLLKDSTPLTATTSDDTGVFRFNAVPRGPTNILVLVPSRHSIRAVRLFGSFSL